MPEYESKMPTTLSAEDKQIYKHSMAKAMVFWTIGTRSNWCKRLEDGDFHSWKTKLPNLANGFQNGTDPADPDLNFFFGNAQGVAVQNRDALINIFNAADTSWVRSLAIDQFCPSDEAIDLMFKAFADHIDALPEP